MRSIIPNNNAAHPNSGNQITLHSLQGQRSQAASMDLTNLSRTVAKIKQGCLRNANEHCFLRLGTQYDSKKVENIGILNNYNKKIIMKNIFLTLVGVAMLTTVTLAQSPEESETNKNPDRKDNATKRDHPPQDTIQRKSKQSDTFKGAGVGVAESNESDNSTTEEKETVTQKEKTNKPGIRSQVDEDETGKKPKKSDKDNPE